MGYLGLGYVLMFFSEPVFYGRPPGGVLASLGLLLVYALVGYLVLWLYRAFAVQGVWGLVLLGAVYGWVLEGAIAGTAFADLPFSLSFTALAWHLPFDVGLGLYLLPRWLAKKNVRFNAAVAAALGLAWGLWAAWPPPVSRPDPGAFFAFALISTALLLFVYVRVDLGRLKPGTPGVLAITALLFLWFLLAVAPGAPISLGLLPFLLGASLWGLGRLRGQTPAPFPGPPRRANLWAWGLFPLAAGAIYAALSAASLHPPTNVVLYLALTPLGALLWLLALSRAARARGSY